MMWLLLLVVLTACNDVLDDQTGKYALDTYTLTKVSGQTTTKLGKGVKKIDLTLTDGTNTLQLAFGCKEWTLPAASYSYTPSSTDDYSAAVGNGNFAASLQAGSEKISLGTETSISVTKDEDGIYSITLLSLTENRNNVKAVYSGTIDFMSGVDDPEANGYIISVTESAVADANQQVYPALTKYIITVSNPDGLNICELDAVNQAGLSLADLVGTYTIQGYPTEAGLMDNGWVVYYPEYYVQLAGGTYYTDANNVKQYVTSGTITITAAEDADGNPLYSFSGSNLSTLTATNVAGKGRSFSVLFANEVEVKGTVLTDKTIHSTVMDMDMLYSVYLPPSWDGTKTFPVLYLLHGADGGNNNWLTGGKIDVRLSVAYDEGTAPEMIVIMPNCTVNGKNLFYCNGYQGDYQYMTFFFNEFLPAVEKEYNVKSDRAHRAIGGLSMGGYGSLYYGGLHPEMFCYVYACSPATSITGTPDLYELYGKDVAAGAEMPGITMEIGTSDYLYTSASYFKAALDYMNIAHEYIERDGAHDWDFWMVCTPKIVAKVGACFSAAGE